MVQHHACLPALMLHAIMAMDQPSETANKLSIQCFLLRVALTVMYHPSNRTVTKTTIYFWLMSMEKVYYVSVDPFLLSMM